MNAPKIMVGVRIGATIWMEATFVHVREMVLDWEKIIMHVLTLMNVLNFFHSAM
jgi:hypothetical protein